MVVIEASDITKTYPTQGGKRALLGRGGIGTFFATKKASDAALAPLSLTVHAGEALGIIGRNGSGKSTLLKIIAGVTAPTSGTLNVNGRVASLLELGAGFHPMLTGRENVYLNAGLLGMRHAQVDACFDDIVEFAELAEAIDHTVDTYSSGMFVRLAFSVAIHTNPDVFLVDEVLAVGDESFQRKCRARILALKAAGKTILFVSHDLGSIQALCDRVLLLDRGTALSRGNAQDTIDFYLRQIGETKGIGHLVHNDTEAIFNHGRIALFHRQRELTAPLGIKVQFYSMGTYHESTDALWHVSETAPTTLTGSGTFPRLPVTLHMTCTLDDTGLVVTVSWENTQALNLSYVALQVFAVSSYAQWHAGSRSGAFPPIGPENHQWSTVLTLPPSEGTCELAGDGDSDLPPLCFSLEGDTSGARFQLDNSDYMGQARIIHLTEAIPTGANPLPPEKRHLGTLTMDPTQDPQGLEKLRTQRRDAQRLDLASISAILHDGQVQLLGDGIPLTDGLHCHLQLRTGDLWVLGHDFSWAVTAKQDDTLTATGRVQRIPCAIAWTVSAIAADTLELQLELTADQELELTEYNLSLCLATAYDEWATPSESGHFGNATKTGRGWTHLNSAYTEGTSIVAQGKDVPTLTLTASEHLGNAYPTAIRTDTDQDLRVLQLLCNPGQQRAFALGTGAHTLFRATLHVGSQ